MRRFDCGRRKRRLVILTTILAGALLGFYVSTADNLRQERELGTTEMSEVIQWGVAADPARAAIGLLFGGALGAIVGALVCAGPTSSRC